MVNDSGVPRRQGEVMSTRQEITDEQWMILKPGMADRGMGLRLFHTKEELEAIFQEFEDADDDDEDGDEVDEQDEAGTGIATSQLRHFVIQVIAPATKFPPLAHTCYRNTFQIRC